ncbi:hypothetical protein O987_28150 [Comamonas testosteroni TK102]|uniref:GTPase-associated system helical domain-containing protein n=2 Tax=Comamonas testosteroni TaxID=285 RepID=A0A076Q1Y1_COMTE|nr:GTPase-associated system all-helical protein GASH [Comamonas sp.]AIJ49677.1 hypothetical protein O987_28150 [Comamonas testosteroni TK102]
MTAAVLRTFLRLSLLDLGAEDERLAKLSAAATQLSNDFSEKPASAIAALLSVIKFEENSDSGAFANAAAAIEQEWNTYQGAFRDGTATTLYRAVTLQALVNAVETQPAIGTAIWLLMQNFEPWLRPGKYEPVIKMLRDASKQAFETESAVEMAESSSTNAALAAAAKAIKVERASLKKRLESASGPSNRNGEANDKPNGSWPSDGPPWSYDFADQMTAILGEYIDFAIAKAAELDAKNHAVVVNRLSSVANADQNLKRSTNLLWWRQALYSEAAQKPYRDLSPLDATIYAVVDLSRLIPPAYEPAVHSLLAEAVLSVVSSQEERDLQDVLQVNEHAMQCLLELTNEAPHIGLVMAALQKRSETDCICQPSLPLHKWAVLLLRELLALQATDYSGAA